MAAKIFIGSAAGFAGDRSDAGIPVVENIPLARTLFKVVKTGQMIPKNLYQAVAEVLAYVYKLRNRTF